jgi:hypothetical protein
MRRAALQLAAVASAIAVELGEEEREEESS